MPKPSAAARIFQELLTNPEARHKPVPRKGLPRELKILRQFQANRLAKTYADLLATKRYGPACRFFLSDIYAPKDFSQRDHDGETIYRLMRKFLPERMLHLLGRVLTLNRLTQELDERLADAIFNQLGATDTITPQLYAEGYRLCDNYQEREEQIDMIVEVGWGVDRLMKNPLTAPTLRMAKVPAKVAGWTELHDFLERGYRAFKKMRGAKHFLETIESREKKILHNLFSAEPDPFRID